MWLSKGKYDELERLSKLPVLTGIERNGRENTFIFNRNGRIFQIKTMGVLSDNLPEWKRDLLE
jgi:hypothetical protein